MRNYFIIFSISFITLFSTACAEDVVEVEEIGMSNIWCFEYKDVRVSFAEDENGICFQKKWNFSLLWIMTTPRYLGLYQLLVRWEQSTTKK